MSETPKTDAFVRRTMMQMDLDPEDFASPWAYSRTVAMIEQLMTACEDFMKALEREGKSPQ